MIKKKIILDCDPGHDDAVAIMLAIANNEIDLLGITCVGGNATLENTKLNALKICSLLNREDIPIYAGADKPIFYDLVTAEHVHGKSGLDTDGDPITLDKNHKIQDLHAVDFIIKTCKDSDEPIYLCPTGPLTNIALSLKKEPSIKDKIKGLGIKTFEVDGHNLNDLISVNLNLYRLGRLQNMVVIIICYCRYHH